MCEGPRPATPVPGVVKVEMIYTLDQQEVINIFHAEVTGTPDVTEQDLDETGALFKLWHAEELRPTQAAESALQRVVCTDLSVLNGMSKEYPVTPVVNGGGQSPQLPNNNTLAVKWGTAFRGRSFRGRTFHIGLQEAQVTANIATAATVTALLAAYQDLLDRIALSIDLASLVVVSYCGGGAWRAVPLVTPISSVSIDPTIDSQRRRLPGRGN